MANVKDLCNLYDHHDLLSHGNSANLTVRFV